MHRKAHTVSGMLEEKHAPQELAGKVRLRCGVNYTARRVACAGLTPMAQAADPDTERQGIFCQTLDILSRVARRKVDRTDGVRIACR